MKARSTALPLLLLLVALPLGGGCLFNPPEGGPGGSVPPEYLPYYDADPEVARDNLVANFIIAWEARDLPEYRDSILYSGTTEAMDGLLYRPFMFYYDRSLDPDLPESDLFDVEVHRATNMFGGLPGHDSDNNVYPGIRAISLSLTANNTWKNPDDVTVEGDDYPAGTKQRAFDTNMLITLKSAVSHLPGNITAWTVEDRLIFYVIPVRIADPAAPGGYHTVYRLWKWRDVIN